MFERCRYDVEVPQDLTSRIIKWKEEEQSLLIEDEKNTNNPGLLGRYPINSKTLQIGIVYHILYRNSRENLSLNLIQAQHEQLNQDFTASNEDLSHLPHEGSPYHYETTKGNPNILFLPLKLTDNVHIKRVKVADEFRNFDNLLDILTLNLSAPITGKLNIFIAPMTKIMGQAIPASNLLVIDFRCIGSLNTNNPQRIEQDGAYAKGRCATHQIGHAFSLSHAWTPEGIEQIPDITKQQNPNFIASLKYKPKEVGSFDFIWDGEKDNFWLDENKIDLIDPSTQHKINHPYSCGIRHEFFYNFLDFGTDINLITWSQAQAEQIHLWVKNAGLLNKYNPETGLLLAANNNNNPTESKEDQNKVLDLQLPPSIVHDAQNRLRQLGSSMHTGSTAQSRAVRSSLLPPDLRLQESGENMPGGNNNSSSLIQATILSILFGFLMMMFIYYILGKLMKTAFGGEDQSGPSSSSSSSSSVDRKKKLQ